jgi:hypothetical protein
MLTIVDLNRNEELSAARMRKVAGGEDKLCDSGCGNGSKADADPANGTDNSGGPQWPQMAVPEYPNKPGLRARADRTRDKV